jgi:hypothetical protein
MEDEKSRDDMKSLIEGRKKLATRYQSPFCTLSTLLLGGNTLKELLGAISSIKH